VPLRLEVITPERVVYTDDVDMVIAPATDGHLQVFRVPVAGGTPTQLTADPTDKTQPAVSRDGTRVAFTVFSYRMQFWVTEP